MSTANKIRILISFSGLTLLCIHIVWPSLAVDSIVLSLLIISVLPWLVYLFKSVELPGGFKFEFQELEKVKRKAEAAGLVTHEHATQKNTPHYLFLEIAETDPSLALAGLRIELEKSLRKLAETKGIKSKILGISALIRCLHGQEIITDQEAGALRDMAGTLNRAAHGEDLDYRTSQWILDVGPQVLNSINKRS